MLVLGRNKGDVILIGDDISVTLEDIKVGAVTLVIQEGTRFPYRWHLRELQQVQFAPGIMLELLRVRRGQVRLGITAPKEVPIKRGELAAHSEEVERLLAPEIGGEAGGA